MSGLIRQYSCSGDIFRAFEKLRAVGHRPPVLVNVDLVGGISADASGLGFLSRHIEGVISTHRHVIELAKEKGHSTVQRLFTINSGAP